MKNTILLYLIICTTQLFAQPKSYDYAYINKKGICVYSNADKKEYFILKDGADPCISADGAKLAYTVNLKNGNRAVAVIDLNTRVKTNLNTQKDNCYGPVWSPDGKWIAFNAFLGSIWTIAVIDANNTKPVFLGRNSDNTYSPVWLANNKGLVVQDMSKVIVLDLAGNAVGTYGMKDMEGGIPELKDMVGNSSSDKFIMTSDNRKIVFSCEVNLPGASGSPPSAVFIYDIAGKTTLRLSPRGYDVSGVIVKGNKVLLTAYKTNSSMANGYSVEMDGGNFKLLLPDCSDVTAKN